MPPDAAASLRLHPPGAWPPRFASSPADREALLVLSHLEGPRPRDLVALARREGSAAACLEAVLAGAAGSDGDRSRAAAVDPRTVRERLRACGAGLLVPGDGDYPVSLLDLPDPPGCLFARGGSFEGALSVAVVGARRCSPYGREVAESVGRALGGAGVSVVSGAALGVDAAAHRGALAVGGPTVAVLGSGIDVEHPRSNAALIRRIAETGVVLSEYPPGVPPERRRFPARNRIVAALARAVVVVEGAPGSGSLLTAGFAAELGREVLAVPGPVTSPLSAAPHELIRDGAGLVRGPADVLEAIGARPGPGRSEDPAAGLSEDEAGVLGAVVGTGSTLDAVADRSGVPAGRALGVLASLELRGLVRAVGGRYERTAR